MNKLILKNIIFLLLVLPNYLLAQPANNWWNQSVFYEIFVRSFYDSNGNGIGDFNGITAKLNYLNDGDSNTKTDLGIKGIWLMPINASPSYHGYDVTDYKAVNAQYGTTADFKNMVNEAHKKGIKVIIDFVINHTSSQHPWFIKSANNDVFYRNFYRWNTTKPTYKGPWGQDLWYTKNGSNYYALFWSEMPDLNYNYQPVKDSIFDAAKFWIDSMNIDGFRLDAAMYLYENGSNVLNQPETFQFWTDFNAYCKSLNPNFMTVGEVWTSTSTVKNYNNKLDNCFDFDLASAMLNTMKSNNTFQLRNTIKYAYDNLQFNKFSTFLTNHDQNRVYDEMNGDINKLKALAAMYLTLPGTPYLYYGEEIGMKGVKPDEKIRTPMQWNANTNAGFSSVNPWQAVNNNFSIYNVQSMETDANSLLNYYKNLIQIRNSFPALSVGTYQNVICSDSAVFSFIRMQNNQPYLVLTNTANRTINGFNSLINMLGWANGNFKCKELLMNKTESFYVTDNVIGGISLAPYETKIIQLDRSTSIEKIDELVELTIYPNPTNDVINIELNAIKNKSTELVLMNQLGKTVYNQTINSNGFAQIKMEGLPAGIYFLKVNNGKTYKIVKL